MAKCRIYDSAGFTNLIIRMNKFHRQLLEFID